MGTLPGDPPTAISTPADKVDSSVDPNDDGGVNLLREATALSQTARHLTESAKVAGQAMADAINLAATATESLKESTADNAKMELYRQGGLALSVLTSLLAQAIDGKLPAEQREGLAKFRKLDAACQSQGIDLDDLTISDLLAVDCMKKDPELAQILKMLKDKLNARASQAFQV